MLVDGSTGEALLETTDRYTPVVTKLSDSVNMATGQLGFVQTATPNLFFGVSRLILESGEQKKTHEMQFLQIGSKNYYEVVQNVIPIGFLHMRLSSDALAVKITKKCLLYHSQHDTQ